MNIYDLVNAFISAVITPPSFNDWQTLDSSVEMMVTGAAFLFREVAIFCVGITALVLIIFLILGMAQDIKRFIRETNQEIKYDKNEEE